MAGLLACLSLGMVQAPAVAAPFTGTSQTDHTLGSSNGAHQSTGTRAVTVSPMTTTAGVPGMDVSGFQGEVDWNTAAATGARFAYIKASEGISVTNPYFASQYSGSAAAGLLHGAYHFALPDASPGATQADYFIDNGATWSADGKTLPPLLDMEYNPYGDACYGMSPGAVVSWISDFATRMLGRTGRLPAIFTTADWWATCTGNATGFTDHPLHLSRWATTPGPVPAGWPDYTLWQNASDGPFPGDQDLFNGSTDQLTSFATDPGPVFSDITSQVLYCTDINWLGSRGISTGWTAPTGARTYRPVQAVNRDAMAAFLYRLAGSPDYAPPATSPFTDITPNTQFYKEITWLAAQGISTGWVEPDKTRTYRPLEPVNRDAMAAFLYRFAGGPDYTAPATSPFTDITPNTQFYKEITWLAANGISTGWTEDNGARTYRPVQAVNRDAMAAFMHRYNTAFSKK